jgi:calcium-translocating P-type ATPase
MAQVIPSGGKGEMLTQENLDSMNVEGARDDNKKNLDELGNVQGIADRIGLNLKTGLSDEQVEVQRAKFGGNVFPEKPMTTFLQYFIDSFNDLTLIILIVAAIVSLVIGSYENPDKGWIEGCAILLAVLLVALVTATNDYQKELQFRNLEKNSEAMERCSVIRNGNTIRINPDALVVGDVVSLKSGDGIPADGVMFEGGGVKCNESALTGEPDDLKKDAKNDPFFLSSTVVTDTGTSGDAKVICVGIGKNSQWGKIKANLVVEETDTPLQERLEDMVVLIGKGGGGSAVMTFVALIIMIWARHNGKDVLHYVIEAFIIAVTILVVAIPEGLPLAVAISLSYSSRQMLLDGNLIRKLEACETMGNATNICTDKTGTLTENRMTVVEGYFAGKHYDQDAFATWTPGDVIKGDYSVNSAINSTVFLQDSDEHGKAYHRPKVVGSATEGAMVLLLRKWGIDYQALRDEHFSNTRDMQFPFNSTKKRSTVIICNPGKVQLLCKGASEVLLTDCTHYTDESGAEVKLDDAKVKEITEMIEAMAGRALRTLAIAHKNYKDVSALPEDYKTDPPDGSDLVLDAIIGIIDPLRSDVKEAVSTAQGAGVMVRMVTGDNIITARAIAKQCGILTAENGVTLTKEAFDGMSEDELNKILPNVSAIEGPAYRKLTPAQADVLLKRVQVMARSSPNDKFLMVKRLNGHNLPTNKAEWEKEHPGFTWETDKDKILPGYEEEWKAANPEGGQVVGVTGDGTNDAPALKASDVGLSMGITGTKVAQNASDIVITDDKFSSIVKAILWGRSVYDNIRRFLQFQLTVNVVALILVFVGSVAGFPPPLNAVMMLWVNLIMDTMGALALGTEKPTPELLNRKPYLKMAPLVSIPMWRNILFQSAYQLVLLFILLFSGVSLFGDEFLSGDICKNFKVKDADKTFDYPSTFKTDNNMTSVFYSNTCNDFKVLCGGEYDNGNCYLDSGFDALSNFKDDCLDNCQPTDYDYTHYTLIFNVFVWCQIFNEFNARQIKNNPAIFSNLAKNQMFMFVIFITVAFQLFIVELGGDWVRTTHIKASYWLWSIILGAGSLPVGLLMRVAPFMREESAADFFGYDMPK